MTPPKKRKKIDANYKYRRKSPFYKFKSFLLRTIALIFLPIGNFWRYHYRISGWKNLRKIRKTGCIVVANHVLHMDAGIISSSIFKLKKLYFIILGSNATIPVVGGMITALGGIPIADDVAGTKKFMKHCSWLLRRKKPILVFPEKAMWHGYKGIRPFDSGAFKIAVSNNVPILPIVITLKNRNKNIEKPKYSVYFQIKEPVFANNNLQGNAKAEELKDRTHKIFVSTSTEFYNKIKIKKQEKEQRKTLKNKTPIQIALYQILANLKYGEESKVLISLSLKTDDQIGKFFQWLKEIPEDKIQIMEDEVVNKAVEISKQNTKEGMV